MQVLIHLILFVLTFVTTTIFGGFFAGASAGSLYEFFKYAILFSLPLLTIILAHEMGHYIAARIHNLNVSLPYFIPVPFGIGTLGAVIRIREYIKSKKTLVDVGAAGPIAGFVVSIPFLIVGLLLSEKEYNVPFDKSESIIYLSEPLVFKIARFLLGLGDEEIYLHPIGLAAWFGIFITALNMLPISQLDGGHILYSLVGSNFKIVSRVLYVGLFIAGFWWSGWWIWNIVVFVIGLDHPPVVDEEDPLEFSRVMVVIISFVVFVLTFSFRPIGFVPTS